MLLPLLAPAIFASLMVVFALSIDDFVVTDYLSSDASTRRCRSRSTRACAGRRRRRLNALATVMVVATLIAVTAAALVYQRFSRFQQSGKGGAVGELAALDV